MMNVHDQRRRDQLAKSLVKAKEQANECLLYLTANDRPADEISNAGLAIEHIEIALEHLGITQEAAL